MTRLIKSAISAVIVASLIAGCAQPAPKPEPEPKPKSEWPPRQKPFDFYPYA